MNESTECRSRERERERARARMRFPFEEACVCFCVFCDVHGGLHAPRVGFCGLPSVMKEDGECCVWWRHGCSAGNVLDPLDCFSVGLGPTATLLSLCGLVGGGGKPQCPPRRSSHWRPRKRQLGPPSLLNHSRTSVGEGAQIHPTNPNAGLPTKPDGILAKPLPPRDTRDMHRLN